MKKEIKDYMENIEGELRELGITIKFKEDYTSSAGGGSNVLNSWKVRKAEILTSKLEGFKEALKILGEI